jgi:DNA-binding NarL/FixJ family response regulator
MRILLIDDHALFREGLALLLRQIESEAEVEQASDCERAFEYLERHGVADLALVDLMLPGMSGMQGLVVLRERWPQMPAVALSSRDTADTIVSALDSGAMGFIPKSASAAQLADALRVVMQRGVYVPPFNGRAPDNVQWAESRLARSGPACSNLQSLGITQRQSDVLRLIVQGMPTKLICRELGLSEGTVKTHTSAVLRALDVTTRTQAVIAVSRLGLRFDA